MKGKEPCPKCGGVKCKGGGQCDYSGKDCTENNNCGEFDPVNCPNCKGTGYIYEHDLHTEDMIKEPCPECDETLDKDIYNLNCVISEITAEMKRAEKLHPHWPDDIIHQVAIMVEESGEAMRAALNHVYEKNDIYSVREEIIQTAAMCLRCLINMEE